MMRDSHRYAIWALSGIVYAVLMVTGNFPYGAEWELAAQVLFAFGLGMVTTMFVDIALDDLTTLLRRIQAETKR